jgi:hypothetical protein
LCAVVCLCVCVCGGGGCFSPVTLLYVPPLSPPTAEGTERPRAHACHVARQAGAGAHTGGSVACACIMPRLPAWGGVGADPPTTPNLSIKMYLHCATKTQRRPLVLACKHTQQVCHRTCAAHKGAVEPHSLRNTHTTESRHKSTCRVSWGRGEGCGRWPITPHPRHPPPRPLDTALVHWAALGGP